MKFRPTAIPLMTVDPYFSIWSCDDALYGGPTEQWNGTPCPIVAGFFINNIFYSMSAFDVTGKKMKQRIYQTDVKITPLSSIYTFENDLVKCTLTFTTPLLLDRPDIMSRPISYVEYDFTPKTDKTTQLVFGVSSRICVNNPNQKVTFGRDRNSVYVGNVHQSPLAESGDLCNIDWGYLHAYDRLARVGYCTNHTDLKWFPKNCEYETRENAPCLIVSREDRKGVITFGYDEIYPIEYFNKRLKEYYTKYFDSFYDMLETADKEYYEIKKLCNEFDAKLLSEAEKLGENYKNIVSISYRQAVSAHKLVEDTDGNLLFLSKECDSNGCIGTLDVTYPSIPLFLKYNPELVNGMLRPIIKYAKSGDWKFDFTPHDVGQYPLANGQVYAMSDPSHQMPIEESGNMLICLATVKKYLGTQTVFDNDKELMKKWADYLVNYGYMPEKQNCTDDFAGHLDKNCNLSIKAIMGIASYSYLSGDNSYMEIAKTYAKKWENDAKANHIGTRLTFTDGDTWSIKYNMVWDNILGFNLFSNEVKENEIKLYLSKFNKYGVPLDCRADYTKIDWLMWSTKITDNKEYFDKVCKSIVDFINETADRVPLPDWYYTTLPNYVHFKARSVVGGLFINLI